MDSRTEFFTFKIHKPSKPSYCFIYSPDPENFAGALDDIVITAYKGPILPDAIVLVTVSGDAAAISTQLSADSNQATLDRIEGKASLWLTVIDPASGTATCMLMTRRNAKSSAIDAYIKKLNWIRDGLSKIFMEEEVVQVAPPGYAYHKPSGELSPFFLKPDLALTSSQTTSYVALAIMLRVFSGDKSKIAKTNTIFVDTMAISPAAYALRDMLKLAGGVANITINSFHSYGGFDEVKKPVRGTSFCLISASSSMSLQDKWISEKEVPTEDVITILTLSSAKRPSRALHSLTISGAEHHKPPAKLSIRIVGESFLPAQEPRKMILLRAEPYLDEPAVESSSNLAGKEVFDLFRIDNTRPGKHRAIYVNGSNLINEDCFKHWLKRTVRQFARATTQHVIHQNDAASRIMAESISDICAQLTGRHIDVINENEVASSSIADKSAIIVCAAVIGKGSRLLQISRCLRDIHTGPRLYAIGYQVAEFRDEIKSLKANIRYAEDYFYDFEIFGSIATGTQLLASFTDEIKETELWSDTDMLASHILVERCKKLRQGASIGGSALLPCGVDLKKAMPIRKGFAFWRSDYTASSHQPEVVATIASILQRAREDVTLKEGDRLYSKTFRQVLLDPENFSRYNDGVIQAALIRCAYPSELDYSGDYSASDFMKHLILRSIESPESDAGESSLEFILALQQGRIKLYTDHFNEISKFVDELESRQMSVKSMKWILQTDERRAAGKEEF